MLDCCYLCISLQPSVLLYHGLLYVHFTEALCTLYGGKGSEDKKDVD
jgi:hypothetical protein